jgi:hypothetical protein
VLPSRVSRERTPSSLNLPAARDARPARPFTISPIKIQPFAHFAPFKFPRINTSENFPTSRILFIRVDFNSTRINTSGNKDLKSPRINTSGAKDLKSRRINTSKKQGRGPVESCRIRISEAKFAGRRAFVASISARPKLLLVPPHIKWVGGNTP